MRHLILFLMLTSLSWADVTLGERDFAIKNSQNLKGNIAVIGNTVLSHENGDYSGRQTNASLYLKYVNTSNYDGNFKNSSQAKLSIPPNATIKWAGLYTQGYLSQGMSFSEVEDILNDPIILTIPNIGSISVVPTLSNALEERNYGSWRNPKWSHTYGSYSKINQLIDKQGSDVNGWITAANIKAYEGRTNDQGDGLGNFGAWTLVVVYEDKNVSLKNISVFDGYKEIRSGKNANIPVSGFLTPTRGDVNSTLSVFSGEGDKNILGDKLFLDGTEISVETNNAFNSSISGVERNPSYVNNQGIDIQNHDVSHIIGNRQTSATIRLTSTQDAYYPSMVAFTTELHQPNVCYVQNLYNEDEEEFGDDPKVGDIITIETHITNMKKDEDDDLYNLETADKVEITVELDDKNVEYEKGSTKVRNIEESNYSEQSDLVEDSNASKLEWRLGIGANKNEGGKFPPNKTRKIENNHDEVASVKFKTKLKGEGDISINNTYSVSYINDLTGLADTEIEECKDFDTGLNVVDVVVGTFNVVNDSFPNDSIQNSTDPLAEENALHTQVAEKEFTVKVISLKQDDNKTLTPYSGDVEVRLVGESEGQTKKVTFKDEKIKPLNFTYPKAEKNLYFEITFDGKDKATSRDENGFAVRPDRFELDFGGNQKVARRDYKMTIKALDYNGGNTDNYNEKIPFEFKENTPDCTEGEFSTKIANMKFQNGIATIPALSYSEVGNIEITIKEPDDSEFAKDDKPHTDDAMRRIDEVTKNFTFIPSHFDIVAALTQPGGDYIYLNSFGGVDSNMTAEFGIEISARDDVGNPVNNYTNSCYAKETDFTFAFEDLDISPNNSIEKMVFFEKTSDKNGDIDTTDDNLTILGIPKSIFKDGDTSATLELRINFDRKTNVAVEPFHLISKSFNIKDEDDVNGTLTTNDHNATFYYGRIHAPNYRGPSPITAEIGYEVYCKDCNKTDFNISNRQSPSNPNWFFNTRHDDLNHGEVDPFASIDGTGLNKIESLNITNGSEDLILTAPNTPHMDRITMTPNPWLVFDPHNAGATTTDFIVEFTSSGEWAGEGTVDKEKTDTIGEHLNEEANSERTNRRISW